MDSGPLPPVPDLIPISALRKRPPSPNNNNCDGASSDDEGGPPECAPCASSGGSEVMGEQRPRRRSANQPAVELIDSARSRGSSGAAPQAPLSRKARPERHRKSDRRRERRKLTRTRSRSKHSKSRVAANGSHSSSAPPHNPRVNPIFVWVRQEDTRIVDVKCEDYDKRNRILLTKTAQGWRAIPRTETLVPTLKEEVRDQQQQQQQHHHHHHHHKNKRSRKGKVRRRSTGVQVSSDIEQDFEESLRATPAAVAAAESKFEDKASSPPWMSSDNVNVESLLPSHTIKVKRSTSPRHSPERDSNVNSAVSESAQNPTIKCSVDKICDVSPLDNLLAVAELEFKQQIESEEWNKTSQSSSQSDILQGDDALVTFNNFGQSEEDQEFIKNLETLNSLIDSEKSKLELTKNVDGQHKSEECDYNDDDDNNLAMDDILSRLEQSLRSPELLEAGNCDITSKQKTEEIIKEIQSHSDNDETDLKSVPEFEHFFDKTDPKIEEEKIVIDLEEIKAEVVSEVINLVESSTSDEVEEVATDLSIKNNKVCTNPTENVSNNEEPTDLSIPKAPLRSRPPSQNSEAIQSPQPSGIPAVPPSPDIVSTTVNVSNKPKSVFLESLLTNTTKKIALNSEVTITPQREPLDLGKCRKSASPTVTCSEEINSSLPPSEPPAKKAKTVDITLKNLLDADCQKTNQEPKTAEKSISTETPKLLELLQNDSETDPLVQLKQLVSDPNIDVPDPLLVPKERFSQILIHPGTEIPKLLKERPELRLPQALAFPHIMQDPNMLVINIHHLESILANKNSINIQNNNNNNNNNNSKSSTETKSQEKPEKQSDKSPSREASQQSPVVAAKKKTSENVAKTNSSGESQSKVFNDLANDINSATQAAFNQMSWFPYMNHLEQMALSSNQDFMKMLSSLHLPMYMNQMPEMFAGIRPPMSSMNFPVPPPMNYGNSLEFNMWQEAMMQAQLLRNKSMESISNEQNVFKSYFEKMNAQCNRTPSNNTMNSRMPSSNKPHGYANHYKNDQNAFQNPYANYNSYQAKASHQSAQTHQKHPSNNQKHHNAFAASRNSNATQHQMNQNVANFYSQMADMEKQQYMQNFNNATAAQDQFHHNFQNFMRKESSSSHRQKAPAKAYANIHQRYHPHQEHPKEKTHLGGGADPTRLQTSQPIDLSGSTTSGGKLKVKQHLIDPTNTPKLLKQLEDVPEVGSTTASIEEMQDAHKHLWHPLFGNQKGYTSPWNWTTVTATGE